MNTTIQDLFVWIKCNRQGKAFTKYNDHQLYQLLVLGINQNTMSYSLDSHGLINGVICGERKGNEYWGHDILTTSKGVVKKLLQTINTFHSDCTIVSFNRHGRKRKFSSPKQLLHKLK